jgi:undecaprenyl diphosphate synthase
LLGDPAIQARIDALEASTKHHDGRHLTILLGYDGRTEMLEAVRALGARASEATPELLKSELWTRDLPSVDLVIRTGGEPHWSAGFLMWLTAESQLVFRDMLWPEFDSAALAAALTEYASRGRRFGA